MPIVWTFHVCCYSCAQDFIIHRVSAADAYAALMRAPCPHCKAHPSYRRSHRLSYLQSVNVPYRKQRGRDVWHWSKHCSHWPAGDYVELNHMPAAEVCNECRALVGS